MSELTSEFLVITIGAILVNNFVLSKFLGICPFLGVSKKLDTALGMSGAVIFVMTLASLVSSLINQFLLTRDFVIGGRTMNLQFLQTLVFIVVIASLVQLVEIILQKVSAKLYESLGIFLPLITTNCAVLGCVVLNAKATGPLQSTWYGATIYGFCSAVGFALALVLFSSLREKLDLAQVPKAFEGTAISLVTAGILAMAFLGFSGLV
ncbi:MAG: RnfABCDGE type electron transport complex subunit A [Pontiellaceae bacterium]|nr:RnfABCDGE type electron transport complex subunit A [Pontiellaceae bacterium]MBN2784590.1 RnfABCDGE type electron transport complex subunit A [Pontiellaceae bacterium]